MYGVIRTKDFERSLNKIKRSGLFKPTVRRNLEEVITLLAERKGLPVSCNDHQLKGELGQYRECHIKGDLLLEYRYLDDILILVLVDIGNHSYLFG